MKFIKTINLAHILLGVWAISLATFLGTFFTVWKTGRVAEFQSQIAVISIVVGLFAFLGASSLYLVHTLFLRKKPVVGHSRSSRMPFYLLLTGLLVALSIFSLRGAYQLGVANNAVQETKSGVVEPSLIPTQTVKFINSAPVKQPSPTPLIQETQNNQSNLVSCNVYGQNFNLTPEKCRYYQQEEAGGNKAGSTGTYTAPTYSGTSQTSTPVPATPEEKYHSYQSGCERKCDEVYRYYPNTSQAKAQCYASCK